jgi:hypothetical protein
MLVATILAAWFLLAVVAGLVIGRGVRIADRRTVLTDSRGGLPADLTVDDVLDFWAAQPTR